MQLNTYLSLGFLALILFITGCNKNAEPQPTHGIYRGVFNRIFDGTDTVGTGVVFLAIDDETMTYTLKGDTNSNVPITNYGKYQFLGSGQLNFQNTRDIDPDTLDDKHYILDTVYNFQFEDSIFNLNLQEEMYKYEYQLKRF